MARNFYYGKDARIVAGSAAFAARINENPLAYGIQPHLAAEYAALDATLQAAYRAAVTPQTRTSIAVREKDDALRAVRLKAAMLASIIGASPDVDDAQLISLGLLPRPTRGARRAPDEPPVVEVAMVVGRRVTVRIRARSSEARKPLGCIGAYLYVFAGSEPPSDPLQYRFEGLASRKTATIRFPDDVASGSTAWISAAWVSRRGKTSAACNPVRVTIQGGPILAMSA
ncbi:MAG: hypothetical protein WBD40_25335 [Tepidisphaeraceae bacterium]